MNPKHSIEKFARLLKRLFLENVVYTVRHGVAKGLKRKGGLGFLPRRTTPEDAMLMTIPLKNKVAYDIGGYEGIMALFFARAVQPDGRVIVFEPNPANCKKLTENVKLNGFTNVELVPLAVGSEKKILSLVFPEYEPARGSIQDDYQANLGQRGKLGAVDVEVDTLDAQVEARHLPPPDFIKMDVEGFEIEVLSGASSTLDRYQPDLFIEIHHVNAEKIFSFLLGKGYSIRHIERGENITSADPSVPRTGHILCTLKERKG